MKSFSWKRKSTNLTSNSAFSEENQSIEKVGLLNKRILCLFSWQDFQFKEPRITEKYDWVAETHKKLKTKETQENKGKTEPEVNSKKLEFLKNEGISLVERDCPWQGIGRFDEALEIKVQGKSPLQLEHDKIHEMKAQAFMSLHEWEEAIEAAKKSLLVRPNWWCAYQTLGRAHLGFGQLQEAVRVSYRTFSNLR